MTIMILKITRTRHPQNKSKNAPTFQNYLALCATIELKTLIKTLKRNSKLILEHLILAELVACIACYNIVIGKNDI